jgi:uncharacterized protein
VAARAPDLDAAVAEARRRLTDGLPGWLRYHDLAHTEVYVAPAAAQLADDLELGPLERVLVLTAVWYHDLGFVERYEENESVAVDAAVHALPELGYSAAAIGQVTDAIWATRLPQTPHSTIAEVVCDADLFVLGTDAFFPREAALRQEMAHAGVEWTDAEWDRRQIAFLEAHRYFTPAARARNDAGKAANLEALRQRSARS